MQNMNDLSARMNLDTVSQNSSNYSGDPPDSLIPAWPADDSRHVKKLSWNDDSRVRIISLNPSFVVNDKPNDLQFNFVFAVISHSSRKWF